MQLVKGEIYNGFEVVEEGYFYRIGVHYWRMKHISSGAELVYTDRDDGQLVFSASFRTFPEDDTGVFHILEHSCLDGSESYRLKEPFVNILCSSLAVDLNAMTYPDKTVYYYITTNEQDYMNLMSVYLDSIFHPLLLSDRRIFQKEAWHFEPDGNGGLIYNGVVFNEMQGRENMADNILWYGVQSRLFPENCYAYESGGRLTVIPDLTYERFCETYKRFYSSENCVIYMSGKMDLVRELEYIDKVLLSVPSCEYDRPAPISPHKPVVSPNVKMKYQLPEGENIKLNTRLALAYVLGDGNEPEESFAMYILSLYLAMNPTSPLSHAVLDAGIGQDFAMTVETYFRQPIVAFTLGKSEEENAEKFKEIILSSLHKFVEDGLDYVRLTNLLDKHEIDCRRQSLDTGMGFRLMETLVRNLTQLGYIITTDELDVLREKMSYDDKYFEHLIEKYIIDSKHWTLVRCVPSTDVAEEKKQFMSSRLINKANNLRENGDYDKLINSVEEFRRYLGAPDDPEEAAKVPYLSLSDMSLKNRLKDATVFSERLGEKQIKTLFYEGNTNGIILGGFNFDLKKIPPEDLFYAYCLSKAIFSLPTQDHSAEELSDIWVKCKTLAEANVCVYTKNTDDVAVYLDIGLNIPYESIAESVELLSEYTDKLVFDREILRRLFSSCSSMKDELIWSGNTTASSYASRCVCLADAYFDELMGISAYRRFKMLEDSISLESENVSDTAKENLDTLILGMKRVYDILFNQCKPTAYLIGSREAYSEWVDVTKKLKFASKEEGMSYTLTCPPPLDRALVIGGDVNYCAEVFDAAAAGYNITNRYLPVCRYLYGKYLWDEVRAKGGAYGAGIVTTRWGIIKLSSYRDPRVKETYDIYADLPDWLHANIPGREEIEKNIISSASSSCFAPESVLDAGKKSVIMYMRGSNAEKTWAKLIELFDTTKQDFEDFADMLKSLNDKRAGICSAIGNRELLEKADVFEEITEL